MTGQSVPAVLEAENVTELRSLLRQRERELSAIRRISDALFRQTSVADMVHTSINVAVELLDAEVGSLQLYDADSNCLIFRYVLNPPGAQLQGMVSSPVTEGIAGLVFRTGEPDVDNAVAHRPEFNPQVQKLSGYRTRNMITVPVRRPGCPPIGVLQVINGKTDFDDNNLQVLTAICDQVAQAIELMRLQEEARKGELLNVIGDLAHDIKNLQTPIQTGMWTMEGLLADMFGKLDHWAEGLEPERQAELKALCAEYRGEYEWLVMAALEGADRVQAHTREIADAIRGETMAPVFACGQVNDVVRDVARALSLVAGKAELQLEMELNELPQIKFDSRLLFNALYNLVNNAIPETPPGGRIVVRTGMEQVAGAEPRCRIEIVDNGRGMSEEVRGKLFTGQAVSTKPGGSGLGTRIAARVVQRHHGAIEAESAPGRGTTIRVWLPLSPAGE